MSDTLPVLALAVAVTLPILLLVPKAAALRDNVMVKWNGRVDLAYAGLTERAVSLLRRLQRDTEALLGSEDDVDPASAFADPAKLRGVAANFQRTLTIRSRLKGRYRSLMRLAVAVPILSALWIIAVWSLVADYVDLVTWCWVQPTAFALAGLVLVSSVAVAGAYFYLEWKLTTADAKGQPSGSPAKRGAR